MNDYDKLLKLYHMVHGEVTGSCYLEVATEDDGYGDYVGVRLMKDGNLCGYYSKYDLLFDALTKDW